MKIGVISDTHDFFDPKIPDRFEGVDHILHAGDIGLPWILLELESIAPVTAVGGNTDEPILRYADLKIAALGGRKFLLQHIVNPRALTDPLKQRIAKERPAAVIFGHTHKPFSEVINGVLYFNPGYSGRQRFELERTVAILHCDDQGVRHEFMAL
jgi:uncharacterized protein